MFTREATLFRRVWRSTTVGSIVEPTISLIACGFGLGALVTSVQSWAMLAIPVIGFLTGLGFAFMGQWFSGVVPSIDSSTYVQSALVTPLFLLAGISFPLTGLPQRVAVRALRRKLID